MRFPSRHTLMLLVVPLLLSACGTAHADPTAATASKISRAATAPSAAPSMSPGMSMAPGTTMTPGMSMPASKAGAPGNAAAGFPPASAKMICGADTRRNVASLLALHTPPVPRAQWRDHLYNCTYDLAGAPLVLSVKQSPDTGAARGYFQDLKRRSGETNRVTGLASLGLPAFETGTGVVAFVKDNMTLTVNASALPHRLGPHHTSRTDLAYTLATDVLACWQGK